MKYTKHRMIRLSDTTHKIAGGLALGAAISFSPLVGTHFVQVGIIAWILRINVLAGFVGTFVGNPWTFPFIWWGSYALGSHIFHLFGWHDVAAMPADMSFDILWDVIKDQPLQIFLPWMLGGYALGLIVAFPAYLVYYQLVKAARAARTRVRMRRMKKAIREVTGQDI